MDPDGRLEQDPRPEDPDDLLDSGSAAPPAEHAQPEAPPDAPALGPAAEADTEPDTSAAETAEVGAAPAEVDLDDPVDQQTIDALAEIQTLLQSEGLDDMVRDHQAMAELIQQLKGLVVNADEVRQAVLETTALRRRKAEIERDFALPTRELPYGALMQGAAADGTPYCAEPRPASLQADIDAFCDGIDALVAAVDAAASDAPEPRLPDRRQLRTLATRIRRAGEEPLKAIYTEPRRRVWLAHRIPGINALERERALRMAHNIVLRHAAALRQLRDHYRAPRDFAPPPLRELLQDMDRLSRSLDGRIEGLPALFNREHRERLQALIPGVVAYIDDRTVRALSGARSINYPTGRLAAIGQVIKDAGSFQAVIEASRTLPPGLHRLFLLHWVTEELCYCLAFEAPKGPLSDSRPRAPSRTAFSVGGFLARANKAGYGTGQLLYAVSQRNEICHQGKVWQEEALPELIGSYEKGIASLCNRTDVSLEAIPVSPRPRAVSGEEMKQRLMELSEERGFDTETLLHLFQEDIDKDTKRLAATDPEVSAKNWASTVGRHAHKHLLNERLGMSEATALRLLRGLKPNMSDDKRLRSYLWRMGFALVEKHPENRSRAERDIAQLQRAHAADG
jgi:hypothetical protein